MCIEFKEIRKEWKAKKKEEEAQRKAEEERIRAGEGRQPHDNGAEASGYGQVRPNVGMPGQAGGHPTQLPPLGYQAAASGNATGAQYGGQNPTLNPDGMPQYVTSTNDHNRYIANNYRYPQSPYNPGGSMYPPGGH